VRTGETFDSVINNLRRFAPRVGTRAQLIAAALMWLIGASILLTRGIGYVHDHHWHAWTLAAGLALGVTKSRLLLDHVGRREVTRIRLRGHSFALGFFSVKAWGLIAVMMSGGILLRQLVVHPNQIGAGILGAVYIGVGSALLLADRIFWKAVLAS